MTSSTRVRALYKYHVANLRSVEIALESTALAARAAIAREDSTATESFIRLYAFLLGAWAEARLRKLLWEEKGFSASERARVLGSATQLDQWKKAVEVAYRRHYSVPRGRLEPPRLSHSAYSRYGTLIKMIDDRLTPVISARNKLAHGQWIYPLNAECTDIASDMYVLINKENLLSLQFKWSLVKSLATLVHEVVVSPPTFDRDFDDHFGQLSQTINNLERRKYEDYVAALVAKRQRGRAARQSATPRRG